MKLQIFAAALALALAPAPLFGQADRQDALQAADSAAIAALARSLTAAAGSDSARAAAIYQWVATNLVWDVAGYLSRRPDVERAEDVWRRRTALCGGYVALFARLAREAGLVTQAIAGYAKGFDYVQGQGTGEANHAWLAVRIAGEWRLVDPTWGSGHVQDGRFVPAFTWAWFLVPADELILSHYPEKQRWQLVSQPLRRRDFERMPAVPRRLLDVGFAPTDVRAGALRAGIRDFPRVGGDGSEVRVLRAPLSGTLTSDAVVELDVIWPGATEMALVSGSVWTPLSRDGDRFQGAATAADAAVYVVGRSGGAEPYSTLLHYRVR